MNSKNNSGGLIVGIIIVIVILIGLAYVIENSTTDTVGEMNKNANQMNSDRNTTPDNSVDTYITTTSTTTGAPTDTAFTIKTNDLSMEQKAMLATAGIDGDEIVITNQMKTCAEQSIGVDRTAAFAGGEKPTVMEAGKLLVCYNK
jgi:hypothetical protein